MNAKVSYGFINFAKYSMNVNKNFKQFITKLLNLKNNNVFNKPNPNKLNQGGKHVRKDNIQHGNNEESKEEEFDLGQ